MTGTGHAPSSIDECIDFDQAGRNMHALIAELYPICRSITGNGLRKTLKRIAQQIPLELKEVPSGTEVFDWTVPKEWNIRDAYIKNEAGERVVDFQKHNLHVLNYSTPVHRTMPLSELQEHIFTDPERPDRIPYRTSYFKENWGFSMPHRDFEQLPEGRYETVIDSTLEDGSLTYGECVLPGESDEEIFFSAHVCHPSLANDNLSGIALSVALAQQIKNTNHRYTYRFVFAPGTIGAITWLAQNDEQTPQITHGLIFACVGDRLKSVYKLSRSGAKIDRVVEHVLKTSGAPYEIEPFSPYGYDERQYCSPGFDLPIGCFMKSPPGQYDEYHSSADNLDLVKPEFLAHSLRVCMDAINVLENDGIYVNQNPKCEPMLGKRGLYGALGGGERKQTELAMLWVLNFSDGAHTLFDIAEKASLPFPAIHEAAALLIDADLLRPPGE